MERLSNKLCCDSFFFYLFRRYNLAIYFHSRDICTMIRPKKNIEQHPLEPFLPEGAKILMLGSFPPSRERWSMEFFYPNRQNDMWRIMGLIFYGDKDHFYIAEQNRFDKGSIESFCRDKGIALYDTAREVRRLKDNASDKFLEVVTPTDISALLKRIPHCHVIITTGQKATDTLSERLGCDQPAIGSFTQVVYEDRELHFWRMPSTSRAYPLALERKAEYYRKLFIEESIIP